MKRPKLHTVAPAAKPAGPSLALVKKALRLFAGRGITKATRHQNARKWLAARAALGDRHILNRATPAKWGQPGEVNVGQVHAPRRLGNK